MARPNNDDNDDNDDTITQAVTRQRAFTDACSFKVDAQIEHTPRICTECDFSVTNNTHTDQGRSDGRVYRYIYPPKISPWELFCALIAADVVRLLVYAYRTVVSYGKKLYPPKMNFWLRP